MAYSLYTQSFGLLNAGFKVNITEASTGLPAIILASTTGGILNDKGQADLDKNGDLTVYIDTAKTWVITPVDDTYTGAPPEFKNGNIIASNSSILSLSKVTPYTTITSSGIVYRGPCEFVGYDCTVAAGTITVYDNTAALGTVVIPTTTLTTGSFELGYKLALKNGCYVALSGAATVNILVG